MGEYKGGELFLRGLVRGRRSAGSGEEEGRGRLGRGEKLG